MGDDFDARQKATAHYCDYIVVLLSVCLLWFLSLRGSLLFIKDLSL